MADISSKQLQEFLDSQSETLSDLFFKLENSQRQQNKQLNDSLEKLGQILGQKFDRLQNLASNTNNRDVIQSIDKLSMSVDKMAVSNEAMGRQIVASSKQAEDKTGNIIDSIVKFTKVAVDTIQASYTAVTNQLNFNRQMETGGMVTTFNELERAVVNSGVSLEQLSSVASEFKNVMISLNAQGYKGILAFTEISRMAFDRLQQENISFTQDETMQVAASMMEAYRRTGHMHELSVKQMENQTVSMAKLINTLSTQYGVNRSDLMKSVAQGPGVLFHAGLRQQGWTDDQILALNTRLKAYEDKFGTQLVDSWKEHIASGGQMTPDFVKNNLLTAPEISSAILELAANVQNGVTDQSVYNAIDQKLMGAYGNIPEVPYMAAKNEPMLATMYANRMKAAGFGEVLNQVEGRKQGDKEFDRNRQETIDLMHIGNKAARDMYDATNLLRDQMIQLAGSAGTYKAISDAAYGSLRNLAGGFDKLTDRFASAYNKLTGQEYIAENRNTTGASNISDALEPDVSNGAAVGRKIVDAIKEGKVAGGSGLKLAGFDTNGEPIMTVSGQLLDPRSPARRIWEGDGTGGDWGLGIGAGAAGYYDLWKLGTTTENALTPLSLSKLGVKGTMKAVGGKLIPAAGGLYAGYEATQSYKQGQEAFEMGNDRLGYAKTSDAVGKGLAALSILAGVVLSCTGLGATVGAPLIYAGSAYLAGDTISEFATGGSLAEHASNGIYDMVNDSESPSSYQEKKLNLDNPNTLAMNVGESNREQTLIDLERTNQLLDRVATSIESMDRKTSVGVNIYDNV